jgi:hypothetical protein
MHRQTSISSRSPLRDPLFEAYQHMRSGDRYDSCVVTRSNAILDQPSRPTRR